MMTTAINQTRPGQTFARTFALCLLALAATLVHSREARAQFTTSGNNTTTTNNVGVGTGAPEQVFHANGPSEVLSTGTDFIATPSTSPVTSRSPTSIAPRVASTLTLTRPVVATSTLPSPASPSAMPGCA